MMEASMSSPRSTLLTRGLVLALIVALAPACNPARKKNPPSILAVVPPSTASSGIGVMPNILVQFDRAMDDASVKDLTNWSVVLSGAASGVPITVEHLTVLNQVRIIPTSLLANSSVSPQVYGVFVGGALKSADGTALGATVFFSFDTTTLTTTTSTISWGGVTTAVPGVNPGEITFTWGSAIESSLPITANYDVYVSTVSGGENLMVQTAPSYQVIGSATGGTIVGLAPATLYFIKVQPRDSAGAVFTALVEISSMSAP
jgi:hypothetical protein